MHEWSFFLNISPSLSSAAAEGVAQQPSCMQDVGQTLANPQPPKTNQSSSSSTDRETDTEEQSGATG